VAILDGDDYMAKSRVLDELKTIFAFQADYPGKTLSTIVSGRGTYFTTLEGPSSDGLSKELSAELLTKRAAILKDYGSQKFDADPTAKNNLIGYTAFYRPGLKIENKNQRYSMTCIGETSCQGEPVEIDSPDARSWFTENLKTNAYEMQVLRAAIKNATMIEINLTDAELIEAFSTS
jgi:alpha-L-fucosidase